MTRQTRTIGSPDATRAVDWEQRVDFPRLRQDRRPCQGVARSIGSRRRAPVRSEQHPVRHGTHIGEGAGQERTPVPLLGGAEPILWDFGSAARHHQLFAPWLPKENFRAGVAPMRGDARRDRDPDRLGERIAHELREHGLEGEPLGVDMATWST